jgi:hypothetical protein
MDKAPFDLNLKLQAFARALPKIILTAPYYLTSRFSLVVSALFICGCAGLLSDSGPEAAQHSHIVTICLRWLAALSPVALLAGFAVWYRRLQAKLKARGSETPDATQGNVARSTRGSTS